MSERISVVIPARNEQDTIGSVVTEINKTIAPLEIIVVNDGSNDQTATVAANSGARVVTHPYPKGNGAAIKTGAREARGEILLFMDGDGQHQPADAAKIIRKYRDGYDMVVGARASDGQASIFRAFANMFYNRLASWITGHRIEDLTSGLRAAHAERFREFLYLLPNGFSYPTTSTMAFFKMGYSVVFEPITVLNRKGGKSHISLAKDGIRFLLIIFRIGTLYSPLKLFAPISLVLFLVGASYYAYTFINFGRFTNMSALLLTTSILVFLIGLVSEQITELLYSRLR